jgi:hypothetical protein
MYTNVIHTTEFMWKSIKNERLISGNERENKTKKTVKYSREYLTDLYIL